MTKKWLLEGYIGKDGILLRIPLDRLPVTVGRDPLSSLPILKSEISRNHAVFDEEDGNLYLTDLGSTNGTFINHQRLNGRSLVQYGDVIHFASYALRLLDDGEGNDILDDSATQFVQAPRQNNLPTGLRELQLLLSEKALRFEYQPIVTLDGDLYAYELLGRGQRQDLPQAPVALFHIAESVQGKALELSRLMRNNGVQQVERLMPGQKVFVNTHPSELADIGALLQDVDALAGNCRNTALVLEIHEDAIADVGALREFSLELQKRNILLAYDDFGAGQARLLELVDVPVAYVKFDMGLIRGLHQAPNSKRQMVNALAQMTHSLGIKNLAEGVEVQAELDLCADMGFDLIQGYYFSKPRRAMDYSNPLAVLR